MSLKTSILEPKDAEILHESGLCLVGYGAQGRAEAMNLKRSGIPFVLALRRGGPSWRKAESDGFLPLEMSAAFAGAKTVALNLPDHLHSVFYKECVSHSQIERLIFAHGFSTQFKQIPIERTHLLVAPKGAAAGLAEYYGTSNALPALLGIEGSEKNGDREIAESYARAIGCNPKMLVWASFKDETECDLFSEQVLLCGGVSSLLRKSYEVLIEAGYKPEAAYLETVFELKLIVDLLWKEGITGMRAKISPTARYGDITRGDRIIDDTVKNRMIEVLGEIQSGKFAKEFLEQISSKEFESKEREQAQHPLEKTGMILREILKTI